MTARQLATKTRQAKPARREPELLSRVRAALPHARKMIIEGWNADRDGLHSIAEERLKGSGTWQKHDRNNTGGNPDALCNMFVDAAEEGFVLGIAYALHLNGSLFLKGGAK
jgi:hypothetical protein